MSVATSDAARHQLSPAVSSSVPKFEAILGKKAVSVKEAVRAQFSKDEGHFFDRWKAFHAHSSSDASVHYALVPEEKYAAIQELTLLYAACVQRQPVEQMPFDM
ncbi:hypothetical protein OSTOST_09649, partial [Ostertagia ostertagi]